MQVTNSMEWDVQNLFHLWSSWIKMEIFYAIMKKFYVYWGKFTFLKYNWVIKTLQKSVQKSN